MVMLPDEQLLQALALGKICLHPAGTLPGLTCRLDDSEVVDRLLALKGRTKDKPFIGLVPSLIKAISYWQPISRDWQAALESSWPGPLTVIARANHSSPITGENQTLALRVPNFSTLDNWMYRVLEQMDTPLLSTSVNFSGEKAATNWQEAVSFAQKNNIFVPSLAVQSNALGLPSTVIEILDQDSFVLLRSGGFDVESLKKFGLSSKVRS
jgi:L-threonylcarbamoyladenylate synthase